jgi:hypothetical protein
VRNPGARGRPIDAARFAEWTDAFAGYSPRVTRQSIEQWLSQFAPNDRDLAARVLDAVEYHQDDQLAEAFRALLSGLSGWSKDSTRRKGRWWFVPFSTGVGESGDAMLHLFRRANGMSGSVFSSLFIHKSELLQQDPGPEDTVAFVDDFAGTGRQAVTTWEPLAELLTRKPRTLLVLAVGVDQGLRRIASETSLVPHTYRRLDGRHNFFAPSCTYFRVGEKGRIDRYCRRADPSLPHGFGACGLLLVLAHGGPNDSLPILHTTRPRRFRGLFPR